MLEDLDWMAGSWFGQGLGGRMEEHWTAPAGGTMFGLNRVVTGDKTINREWISIEPLDDGIVMRVRPGGFDGKRTVAFCLTKLAKRRAVSDLPENDFPTRIVYERRGDRLTIELVPCDESDRSPITIELERGNLADDPSIREEHPESG